MSDSIDVVYFWGAILIAVVPVAAFVVLGVLVTRGYFRRSIPDGGGDPRPTSPPQAATNH